MSATLQDLRVAGRALRRRPTFTAACVATMALAIGAVTAMFSVVEAVLLRPLPFQQPEQLAMVWSGAQRQGTREGRSAYLTVDEWRQQSHGFADLALFDPVSATLSGPGETTQVTIARVSPNLLALLGLQPLLGRAFYEAEAERRQSVILVSHRFWQSRLGGAPTAVGRVLQLDGVPSEIVGVLPDGFQLPGLDADVWQPHTLFPDWQTRRSLRGGGSWYVVGRLRPGFSTNEAQTELTSIARRQNASAPAADREAVVSVVSLSQYVVGARSRLALWMLAGAVSCVLLIAGANVASLNLARSVGQAREIAVRIALGASKWRVLRQLLTESLLLAAVSGALGTVLAQAGVRAVQIAGPRDLARLSEVRIDFQVLAWALAMSGVLGTLVGLAPAGELLRQGLRPSGGEAARGVSGSTASRRLRRGLVVAEFALAIILLTGAGLLVRSWWSLEQVDPGFKTDRVLSMQLAIPASRTSEQRTDVYERVIERLAALPGVQSAGVIGDLFIGDSAEQTVTAEGQAQAHTERLGVRRDEISSGFFTTVSTPLQRGRSFSSVDRPDSPLVAIVNERMARRLWPDQDPLGRRFKLGAPQTTAPWFRVVGVVTDMRRQGADREPVAQMFEPLAQNPSRLATVLVVTALDDPLRMASEIRSAVHQVDAQVSAYGVTTLETRLGSFQSERRFQTALVLGFALVALVLAAIGVYGLIQYSVVTRTQEIAIRIAIGAQAADILRMILREGISLSLIGVSLGLVGAFWVASAGSTLLFGVSASDPLTFAGVCLVLLAVAGAASYFPARRAMQVEPTAALRQNI